MDLAIEGKTILITGAASGVGRETAALLARYGARLVLNDLGCDAEGLGADAERVQELARELKKIGAEVITNADDISLKDTPRKLVDLSVTTFGRLDGVIHAARIHRQRSLMRLTAEDIGRTFDVNVMSAFELARVATQVMSQQGTGGSILLTASPLAFAGATAQSSVAAASAAIVALVRSAAAEFRRQKIRVNAIAPTSYDVQDSSIRDKDNSSMAAHHVALVACYLISELSANVTGEVIGVAGIRAYLMRQKETPGIFADANAFTLQELKDKWSKIYG